MKERWAGCKVPFIVIGVNSRSSAAGKASQVFQAKKTSGTHTCTGYDMYLCTYGIHLHTCFRLHLQAHVETPYRVSSFETLIIATYISDHHNCFLSIRNHV